jgi:hypothetical protein
VDARRLCRFRREARLIGKLRRFRDGILLRCNRDNVAKR